MVSGIGSYVIVYLFIAMFLFLLYVSIKNGIDRIKLKSIKDMKKKQELKTKIKKWRLIGYIAFILFIILVFVLIYIFGGFGLL